MARKYLAQMVIILDYLHTEKKVAHRDLKPENFLLDSNQHLKLIDFGSAIEIGIDRDGKEAGTQNYAAPELLVGREGGLASDIWSLGCILYEMFTGKPPFRSHNLFSLIEIIEVGSIKFTDNFPELAKDLCLALLQVKEENRLNIDEIKTHPFFGGLNFRSIWSEPITSVQKEEYEIMSEMNIVDDYIPSIYCPSSDKVIKQGKFKIRGVDMDVKLTEDGKIKYSDKKTEVSTRIKE
jgi:serine/threonine protein kinase